MRIRIKIGIKIRIGIRIRIRIGIDDRVQTLMLRRYTAESINSNCFQDVSDSMPSSIA